MQVGMNPTTLGAFVPLGRFVCSRPIALRVPPQSSECECESGWRFGCGEGLAKIFDGHFECRRPHVRMVSLKQIINLPRPPRPPPQRRPSICRYTLKSRTVGCRSSHSLKLPSLSILQVGLIRNRSTDNIPVMVNELKANLDVAEVSPTGVFDRSTDVGERLVKFTLLTHHLQTSQCGVSVWV